MTNSDPNDQFRSAKKIESLDRRPSLPGRWIYGTRRPIMRRVNLAAAMILIVAFPALAEKPTRFWNLTSSAVTDLRLSPAGAGKFGENLCLGDKDKEVEHDERLAIPGLASGQYDAKIGYEGGRLCAAKNIAVEAGQAFSLEDKDLVDCVK